MQTSINPYLNFNGNCGEAMKFYQSVLGGELTMQKFGDVPGASGSAEVNNRIMHAHLRSGVINIMASDGRPDVPVVFGSSVHLSLNGTNDEEITGFFTKLAEGGTVDMPLEKQFWGDKFGMLTDKFGLHWMVNIAGEKE